MIYVMVAASLLSLLASFTDSCQRKNKISRVVFLNSWAKFIDVVLSTIEIQPKKKYYIIWLPADTISDA